MLVTIIKKWKDHGEALTRENFFSTSTKFADMVINDHARIVHANTFQDEKERKFDQLCQRIHLSLSCWDSFNDKWEKNRGDLEDFIKE
jgi:hypothetical protein